MPAERLSVWLSGFHPQGRCRKVIVVAVALDEQLAVSCDSCPVMQQGNFAPRCRSKRPEKSHNPRSEPCCSHGWFGTQVPVFGCLPCLHRVWGNLPPQAKGSSSQFFAQVHHSIVGHLPHTSFLSVDGSIHGRSQFQSTSFGLRVSLVTSRPLASASRACVARQHRGLHGEETVLREQRIAEDPPWAERARGWEGPYFDLSTRFDWVLVVGLSCGWTSLPSFSNSQIMPRAKTPLNSCEHHRMA